MYKLTFALLLIAAAQPAVSASQRPRRGAGATAPARIKRDPAARAPQTPAEPAAKVVGARRKTAPAAADTAEAARATRAASKDKTSRARGAREEVTFPSGESLRVARVSAREAREHRDPNGSGNPLLVTSGENRAKRLARNFTAGEFARSGKTTFDLARIAPQHVGCLQNIRDRVGRPVRIDSGYRSFKYNKEIYEGRRKKVKDSRHISGTAADIRIEGMSGQDIAVAAIDACGPDIGLGLGPHSAHVDGRGRFGIWKYKGVSDRQVAEVKLYREARMVAQKARARKAKRSAPKRA
jgi:uncharacterized protein YcbK (DUF882 family)